MNIITKNSPRFSFFFQKRCSCQRNLNRIFIRINQAQEGNTGKPEITVVNIQRFAEDRSKVDLPAYATNLQRVFIIDEAHRGYKPEGSFLANLLDADKNAIKEAGV